MKPWRWEVAPYLFLLPAIVLLVTFVYAPAAENIRYSLFSWSALSPDWTFVGLENYRRLLHDPIFWRALTNNTIYAVISIIVQVGFALVLAAVLQANLFGPMLRSFFRVSLFLPSILPVTVVGLLWQLIYQPSIGLIDQLLYLTGLESLSRVWLGEEQTALFAVIAVSQWQWTGYIMVLFMVAIQAIPRDLYEAMEIEGASKIQQFWHLTVPGVRETTLVMIIITIFGAFKVFDIVWVMTTGGPNNASEVLGTYMYRSAFREDLVGYGSAIAVVIFAITMAIGMLQIRLQRERL
jgi:raffinose/stachyose/melibiose transport system permease protein